MATNSFFKKFEIKSNKAAKRLVDVLKEDVDPTLEREACANLESNRETKKGRELLKKHLSFGSKTS